MNFRAKTSLTIAVLTALALGGAFAAVSAAFNGLQRRQLDASLWAVADEEAAEAPRNHFSFSNRPGPAANDVGPLTKFGVIYGETGSVLSATPPFDVRPPARAILRNPLGKPFDLRYGGDHLRGVLVPIRGSAGKRLFLATSRDDLEGDERFLYQAMSAAFGVSVLWVALVAYWMGGRLTRDHQAIAAVVRAVAAGDLSARIRVRSNDPAVAQLARDVDDMVDRLAALVSSQQRFIAHAAHELRSPLATLHGELQQALRRPRDVASYQNAIATALAAAKRLIVLADDLLALARAESARVCDGQPTPLLDIVEAARASVEPFARSREVTINLALVPTYQIADRNGDAIRLLRNLLENAVHYSPREATVQVDAYCETERVIISVSDAGPGIDESERDKIFEPFFRGRGASGTEGSGLGLGIAREIARSYGGDLVLDGSRSEPGARFVISLPRLDSPASQRCPV